MEWRLHHRRETASTNADAICGAPWDVFTADFQTAGRGRLGHKWLSEPGENLIMSAVVPVGGLAADHAATLPLAVGLAVADGLAPWTDVALKWPNDIMAGDRKIAGILCERHGDNVVAGVGVNVGQRKFPDEIAWRATSLALLGAGANVAEVRDSVLASLADVCDKWRNCGFASVWPRIAAIDWLKGRELAVAQTDDDAEPVRGICGGIQRDGFLLVGAIAVWAGEAHVLENPNCALPRCSVD